MKQCKYFKTIWKCLHITIIWKKKKQCDYTVCFCYKWAYLTSKYLNFYYWALFNLRVSFDNKKKNLMIYKQPIEMNLNLSCYKMTISLHKKKHWKPSEINKIRSFKPEIYLKTI